MTTAGARISTQMTRLSPERVIVMLIAVVWLVLCSPIPRSLNGTGILFVLALIGLDIVLGVNTRWLAFTHRSRLDERQAALRDDAYRTAFHWMRAAVIVMLALGVIGAGVNGLQGGSGPAGVALRYLIAFLEMLAILPTAAIAWQNADLSLERSWPPLQTWTSVLVVPVLALVWLSATTLLPSRTVLTRGLNGLFDLTGATCDQFRVENEVAAGFGGAVGLHAEVCWNGKVAFSYGDPSLPMPGGILPEQQVMPNGPPIPWLTECWPGNSETDFAFVSESCSQQIDADGTMTLTARGRTSPLPGGIDGRDLQVHLVVDRNGKILSSG